MARSTAPDSDRDLKPRSALPTYLACCLFLAAGVCIALYALQPPRLQADPAGTPTVQTSALH